MLVVDGVPADEPYVDHESIAGLYTPTVVVPQGEVFVLGDHRADSIDSRTYGTVRLADIEGVAVARLWPPGPL